MPNTHSSSSPRLGDIATDYIALKAANGDDSPTRVREAQARIFESYQGAILSYLRAVMPDPNSAEDLLSTFSFKLVNRQFEPFRPGQGRFRDYLKTTLFRMVADHRRASGRWHSAIADPDAIADHRPDGEDDGQFLACWRGRMLIRAWRELLELERGTERPLATVLWETIPTEARALLPGPTVELLASFLDEGPTPGARTARKVASALSERFGRVFTEERVREVRMEARDAFQDLLLREVWISIESPSAGRVEDELIDLGLLGALKKAAGRRRDGTHRRPLRASRRGIRSDNPDPTPPTPPDSGASDPRS